MKKTNVSVWKKTKRDKKTGKSKTVHINFGANSWAVKDDKEDGFLETLPPYEKAYMQKFLTEYYNGELDGCEPRNKEFRDPSIHQTIGQIKSCFKNNEKAYNDVLNDSKNSIKDINDLTHNNSIDFNSPLTFNSKLYVDPESIYREVEVDELIENLKLPEDSEKVTRDTSKLTLKKVYAELTSLLKDQEFYYETSVKILKQNPNFSLSDIPFPKFISDGILRSEKLIEEYRINEKKSDYKNELYSKVIDCREDILGFIDKLKRLEVLAGKIN